MNRKKYLYICLMTPHLQMDVQTPVCSIQFNTFPDNFVNVVIRMIDCLGGKFFLKFFTTGNKTKFKKHIWTLVHCRFWQFCHWKWPQRKEIPRKSCSTYVGINLSLVSIRMVNFRLILQHHNHKVNESRRDLWSTTVNYISGQKVIIFVTRESKWT